MAYLPDMTLSPHSKHTSLVDRHGAAEEHRRTYISTVEHLLWPEVLNMALASRGCTKLFRSSPNLIRTTSSAQIRPFLAGFRTIYPTVPSANLQTHRQASTMAAAVSGATTTPTSGLDQFDPEIKDIASYIHHYKIDSDLAVRESDFQQLFIPIDPLIVRYSPLRLPRHHRLRSSSPHLPSMYRSPRSNGPRHRRSQRLLRPWHPISARSYQRGFQHRCNDQVARLQ